MHFSCAWPKISALYSLTRKKFILFPSFIPYKTRFTFGLSFLFQHGALFKVARIDSREKQALFYLENLLGVPLPDAYYIEELKLYPSGPLPGYTFRVQSIISERKVNNETEYLCSFVNYSRKMRTWVKKSDLLK